MAKRKENAKGYTLEVPLDASQIVDFKPEQDVKVAVYAGDKTLGSTTAKLSSAGKGKATLHLDELASGMRAVVGPANASDEELVGLQTIRVDVPGRELREKGQLQLPAVKIHPYYWHWWFRWCRNFTIRGVVLCPNGDPVPGATVCAYDVDWWWWWTSNQQVGCATTDINGAFEINFRWCCGWWPWWWWRRRFWKLEPLLVERINPVLLRDPRLPLLKKQTPRPDLAIFDRLLDHEEDFGSVARAVDPAELASLRDRLVEVLPKAPELEQLRIWPWWPWFPWWDCSPDIIFKVTHDCPDPGTVIVNEGFSDARWNIPTTLDVTLVTNDHACCLELPDGCLEGNCLALTQACDDVVDTIGGNIDAPATPVGYKNPGAVATKADRPYGGRIPISGTVDCMEGVDYYEFEWTQTPAVPASWAPVPADAAGAFTRKYLRFSPLGITPVTFATTLIDGHDVFETLQHYENTNPPADWGANRVWVQNRNRLMNWLTLNNFADGTYYLRVKAYDLVAGHLANARVLEICENPGLHNFIVLTVDNRAETSGPVDPNGHPCGAGTVHKCTTEPDVDFLSVKILHNDMTETDVAACGEYSVKSTDKLQVDFAAYDPDGHLAKYTLHATWGESNDKNLLTLGGTLTPSPLAPAWAPAPPATEVGPTYANALIADPTIRPHWHGGAIRLTIDPATAVFEETCCYQLELYAHKRTIVNCDDSLWGHWNRAEYSFMIVTS
jgi:hypothetical protein